MVQETRLDRLALVLIVLDEVDDPKKEMSVIADAFAGHAGDTGVMGMMPHEVLTAVALLVGIGLALIVLGAIGIWLLFRIERHLRKYQ